MKSIYETNEAISRCAHLFNNNKIDIYVYYSFFFILLLLLRKWRACGNGRKCYSGAEKWTDDKWKALYFYSIRIIYQKVYARFGYVLQIKFSGQSRFIIEILDGCGPERSLGAAAALRCHVVTTQKCRIRFNWDLVQCSTLVDVEVTRHLKQLIYYFRKILDVLRRVDFAAYLELEILNRLNFLLFHFLFFFRRNYCGKLVMDGSNRYLAEFCEKLISVQAV